MGLGVAVPLLSAAVVSGGEAVGGGGGATEALLYRRVRRRLNPPTEIERIRASDKIKQFYVRHRERKRRNKASDRIKKFLFRRTLQKPDGLISRGRRVLRRYEALSHHQYYQMRMLNDDTLFGEKLHDATHDAIHWIRNMLISDEPDEHIARQFCELHYGPNVLPDNVENLSQLSNRVRADFTEHMRQSIEANILNIEEDYTDGVIRDLGRLRKRVYDVQPWSFNDLRSQFHEISETLGKFDNLDRLVDDGELELGLDDTEWFQRLETGREQLIVTHELLRFHYYPTAYAELTDLTDEEHYHFIRNELGDPLFHPHNALVANPVGLLRIPPHHEHNCLYKYFFENRVRFSEAVHLI